MSVYNSTIGYNDNKALTSPGAQTFRAPRDAYLSAVDLYFTSKQVDMAGNEDPISLEIHDVKSNGEPGNAVYGQSTLNYDQVQINDNNSGNTPTEFVFSDPIYLESGKSYAICLFTASQDYQLEVSIYNHITDNEEMNTDSNINPNGNVHGYFWYSTDGVDWVKGDPTGQLGGNPGSLCLKFDIKRAQFANSSNYTINFPDVNTGAYRYNEVNATGNDQQAIQAIDDKYMNDNMNDISEFTFNPDVFTPDNSSITWVYSLDNGQNYQPLNPGYTIRVPRNDAGNSIKIRAYMKGSNTISPVIRRGSLHIATDRSTDDFDRQNIDQELGVGNNQFLPDLNDQSNAGEYISRTVLFQQPNDHADTDMFNQVYGSFEQLQSKYPVDIYFNLNPDSNTENNFKNKWFQLTGYDEYSSTGNGVQYAVVNPRTGLAYSVNKNGQLTGNQSLNNFTQHDYSDHVENTDEGTWNRYHFHVSLKRLWQDPDNRNNANSGRPLAYEIQYKIVFHAKDQYDHPKVRKFETTVNKDDENSQGMTAN